MQPKLKARLRVQAEIRRCAVLGLPAVVARRGDADAGAILIKHYRGPAGCMVLSEVRRADGSPAWLRGTGAAPVAEDQADAYLARQIDRDYDLWVIEIEDRDGIWTPPDPLLE